MFRTEIPLTPLPHQLPPSARVLTLGSCFSDSIGVRLTEFKVATLVNPFGTVFNPLSACKLLRAAAGEDMDWQQHLVEARGRWQSYDLHAEIGADSPVELLQHIQQLTREVGVFLATADVVVLTLGSAYAYRLRETGELVSNCHKIPADQFDKELLTADEIIAAVAETHAYLRRINPKLRFVLTVSPVRHLKDTLVLNSASKAMLRVACHYLSELLPDVTYFPAYELLMDDLRDYRFYASDMLHLSETGENYVWEKFTRTYFDAAFGRFKKEWEGIRQNLGHKPLHPAAPEHRAFLESTLERLRKLGGTADVRMELLHVERELANLPDPRSTAPVEEEVYDDGEERIDIGSFDDQAALDEAQPVAAAQVAVAATESAAPKQDAVAATEPAAPKQDAGRKPDGKKEINRAVFAKTRLTSQASLIRPGAGLLVEDAEDTEPETEDTDTDETTVSGDSAYDHAYSPTVTDLTDETEDDSDESAENEASGEPETAEEAARRKKRRSRGGAKRTKRKHARLAAEQSGSEGQPETSAVATAPAPLPDEARPAAPTDIADSDDEPASEVVYVTEAQLRQPRPQPTAASTPATPASTDEAEQVTPEADEATPEARRSRNNRRGSKREQAPRYGGRPGRQPLFAVDAETITPSTEAAPVPQEAAAVAPSATTEAVLPTPVVATPAATVVPAATTPPATADRKPAARKRPSKAQTNQEPIDEPAAATAPAPAEALPVAPAAAEPAATKAVPAKPARRKPAAKPAVADSAAATVAVTTEAASEPSTTALTEPAKAPARKPAAKPKAAAKAPAKAKAAAKPEKAAAVAPTAVSAPASAATPDAQAPEAAKPAPKAKAKPAAKKAPAKAKPAAKPAATDTEAASEAPAAPAKAPTKPRSRAAAKPAKKAGAETPEDN
ncbi:GSCFA domain-containing protein [Hymenobacter actinosclerus]|uniref:GSCFA family protein n=1 Tax=Hymenobacter actinosclerus TaxID=82805 RepID=A0A1I0ATJ0_9BACT|nr:GSCFA domain-containing protein [Hymenobacter actinosclerus]SES97734.1 GSCFA family protein [Hymenobacter actinosclerus]